MKKEFKVEIIKEGAIISSIPQVSAIKKMLTEIMNKYGDDGWDVSFSSIESHHYYFYGQEKLIC